MTRQWIASAEQDKREQVVGESCWLLVGCENWNGTGVSMSLRSWLRLVRDQDLIAITMKPPLGLRGVVFVRPPLIGRLQMQVP